MKWISVKDRLPNVEDFVDESEEVLTVNKGRFNYYKVGIYDEDLEYWVDNMEQTQIEVTHWQPLPLPPNKEE